MRRPQPYRFEYLRCVDGVLFVGLRGPRGGGRAFPLTHTDLIRLIDAYRDSCGAAAASVWEAAGCRVGEESIGTGDGGIPAAPVIVERGGSSIEEATAGREEQRAGA